MCFDVFAQVVAPHEALVAHRARKPLLPRVSAQVPLELVGPGEPFPTKEPVAHKRPLASVPPQMRFEVRRFPVDFPAARDVTAMKSFPPQAGARRPEPLRLLAVRAVACGPSGVSPRGPGRGPYPRAGAGYHRVSGRRVRVSGDHSFEPLLGQQVLAGRQEVGRGGADASGAERGVREAREVRIVAA